MISNDLMNLGLNFSNNFFFVRINVWVILWQNEETCYPATLSKIVNLKYFKLVLLVVVTWNILLFSYNSVFFFLSHFSLKFFFCGFFWTMIKSLKYIPLNCNWRITNNSWCCMSKTTRSLHSNNNGERITTST